MKKYKLGMEIGCGDRYSSELLNRAEEFEAIQLIEPNPILYKDISSAPNPHGNISTGNFAIAETKRQLYPLNSNRYFYNFGYCSFLQEANSFLQLSCEEESFNFWMPFRILVKCSSMAQIDKGDIDYLILTCHGSEVAILEEMVSRPQVIRTKYYCHNHKHWQYYSQITMWMAKNGYVGTLLEKSQYDTYFHIEYIKK